MKRGGQPQNGSFGGGHDITTRGPPQAWSHHEARTQQARGENAKGAGGTECAVERGHAKTKGGGGVFFFRTQLERKDHVCRKKGGLGRGVWNRWEEAREPSGQEKTVGPVRKKRRSKRKSVGERTSIRRSRWKIKSHGTQKTAVRKKRNGKGGFETTQAEEGRGPSDLRTAWMVGAGSHVKSPDTKEEKREETDEGIEGRGPGH